MMEESKMKTVRHKMKEDLDFKSMADSTLLDIWSKSITTFDAVAQHFKNLEDKSKYQDLNDTTPELNSRVRGASASQPSGANTNQSFQSLIYTMSWPSGLWNKVDTKTKLYLIKWKKLLSSASSFKDVHSLKPPTPAEVEEYENQGKRSSAMALTPDKRKRQNTRGRRQDIQRKSLPRWLIAQMISQCLAMVLMTTRGLLLVFHLSLLTIFPLAKTEFFLE
jgi:hypothetical protein